MNDLYLAVQALAASLTLAGQHHLITFNASGTCVEIDVYTSDDVLVDSRVWTCEEVGLVS